MTTLLTVTTTAVLLVAYLAGAATGWARGFREGFEAGWDDHGECERQNAADTAEEFRDTWDRVAAATTPTTFGTQPAGARRPPEEFPTGVAANVWDAADDPAGAVCGHCYDPMRHGDAFTYQPHPEHGYNVPTCTGCSATIELGLDLA